MGAVGESQLYISETSPSTTGRNLVAVTFRDICKIYWFDEKFQDLLKDLADTHFFDDLYMFSMREEVHKSLGLEHNLLIYNCPQEALTDRHYFKLITYISKNLNLEGPYDVNVFNKGRKKRLFLSLEPPKLPLYNTVPISFGRLHSCYLFDKNYYDLVVEKGKFKGGLSSDKKELPSTDPSYALLRKVFDDAYNQAANGKGKERHAKIGAPFENQVIIEVAKRFGVGALLFQAFKKSEESQRLPKDRAIAELHGAMVYLAAAVIALERTEE